MHTFFYSLFTTTHNADGVFRNNTLSGYILLTIVVQFYL